LRLDLISDPRQSHVGISAGIHAFIKTLGEVYEVAWIHAFIKTFRQVFEVPGCGYMHSCIYTFFHRDMKTFSHVCEVAWIHAFIKTFRLVYRGTRDVDTCIHVYVHAFIDT
jgi:hypothetical protein